MPDDMTLAAQVRHLQDRLDLQDLVIRYAQCNDYAVEPDELTGLFTEDVLLVGVFRDEVRGSAELREYAESIIEMRRTIPYRHHVSNVVVSISGDEASMTAFFILVYRHPVYDGAVQLHRVYYGNLDFIARRTNGAWLISHRSVRLDPS